MRNHKKSTALLIVVVLLLILPLASIKGDTGVTTDAKVVVNDYQLVTVDQEPSGATDAVKVVDWVALDGKGTVTVDRPTGFKNDPKIQPLNGFTTPEVSNNHIIYKDVSVDGARNLITLNTPNQQSADNALQKLPIEVKYSYWLDGRKINNLKDIGGKSGHFRMELFMKNTSKTKKLVTYKDSVTGKEVSEVAETYLPLVIQPTNWFFDNTKFHNMKTDPTGLIFYLPTVYQPGWVVPLFPPATEDNFTIWMEADVTNFSMDPLSLAIAFVYPHTNQTDPLPQFSAGLTELYGGVGQLGAGLAQAVAGLGSTSTDQTLLFGINAIFGGLQQMADPAVGLPAAEAALSGQLIPGVEQLNAAFGSATTPDSLLFGVNAINDGMAQMQAGIGSPTTPDTLLFGSTAITGGLNTIAQGIGSPTTPNTLMFASNALTGGLDQVLAGIGSATTPDTLLYAASQVGGGLSQMKAGIGSASTPNTLLFGTDQINAGLVQMKQGIGAAATPDTLLYAIAQMTGGLQQIYAGIGTTSDPPSTLLGGLQQIENGMNLGPPSPGIKGGLQASAAQLPLLIGVLGQMELATRNVPGGMYDYVNRVLTGMSPGGGGIYDYVNASATILPADKTDLFNYMTTYTGYLNAALGGMNSMNATLNIILIPQVQQSLVDVQTAITGLGDPSVPANTLLYGLATVISNLQFIRANIGTASTPSTLLFAANAITDGLDQFLTGIGSASTPNTLLFGNAQVTGGLTQMSSAIGSPTTPNTLLFGTTAISMGLEQIKDAIGSATTPDTLLFGTHALTGGLAEILKGIGTPTTPDTLLYGSDQVTAGLTQMSAGIGSVTTPNTLLFATNAVFSGVMTMQAGVSTGSTANPGLLEGLVKLDQGTAQAVEGLGSASNPNSLIGGASQINSGLAELQAGLVKAVNEGTNVMAAGLVENIKQLDLTQGQLKLIEKMGNDFDSFMGRVPGANNDFRVLMQTKPVQTNQATNMWIWLLIIGVVAAIGVVLIGSFLFRRATG